ADSAIQSAQAEYTKAQKDLTPLLSRAQQQLDTLSAQTKAELARLSEPVNLQAGEGQRVVVGPDGVPIVIDDAPPKKKEDQKEEVVFDEAEEGEEGEGKKDIKGKGVDRGESSSVATAAGTDISSDASTSTDQTPSAAASAFFRSLSSSVQSTPQFSSLTRDLHSLQSNLSTNLHSLQSQLAHLDVQGELRETQKLAEGYLHKGEGWFADFSKEVGKLAKDAVKIVPPGTTSSFSGSGSGGKAGASVPQSGLSRRELLLYRLRTDPSILLVDPALPPPPSATGEAAKDSREAYAAFVASLQQFTLDGFDTPQFKEKVQAELVEGGEGLAALKEKLVGGGVEGESEGELSEEAFWTRYFFRKAEIEEEEGRRKRVLQGASQLFVFLLGLAAASLGLPADPTSFALGSVGHFAVAEQSDDDFSWDMDDEESTAASVASPPPPASPPSQPFSAPVAPQPQSPVRESALPPAPATPKSPTHPTGEEERSPRASSDTTTASSFDVVGERSGQPSDDDDDGETPLAKAVRQGAGAVPAVQPTAGEGKGAEQKVVVEKKAQESDEDSDWE
ncbi:hypothetical protein JCM11251_004225, partial [Rhodosporidiobolus azoricus]